jgi:hypothetical protein
LVVIFFCRKIVAIFICLTFKLQKNIDSKKRTKLSELSGMKKLKLEKLSELKERFFSLLLIFIFYHMRYYYIPIRTYIYYNHFYVLIEF